MSVLDNPFFIRFCLLTTAAGIAAILSSWALRSALAPVGCSRLRQLLSVWLPTAVVVGVVGLYSRSMALTLVYSSAVAAVTLFLGASLYFTASRATVTPDSGAAEDASAEPLPSLLFPLVLLLWLIGFGGWLDWSRAVALLVGGLAVGAAAWPSHKSAQLRPSRSFVLLETTLGLLIALAAAAAVVSLDHFVRSDARRIPPELLAVTPLAPVIALPLYIALAGLIQQRRRSDALALASGFALLNLAFLIPLLVLLSAAATHLPHALQFTLDPARVAVGPATAPVEPTTAPTSFAFSDFFLGIPLILWRVENVILLIATLALVGVRLRYYAASRALGGGLLLLYAIYLLTSLVLRLT
jgi:hypothetical protein